MTPRCDVLVLGGGPAGAATALALQARGFATLVVERTCYRSANPGELLLGDAGPLLAALGAWELFLGGRPPPAAPMVSSWGTPEGRTREAALDPQGPGWQIDRAWFDPMLAQAAEAAGALVYCGARADRIECLPGGWRVALRSAGSAGSAVNARYLVDATGRAAWLASRLGAGTRRIDRLVGLAARYERSPAAQHLLVEAAPDGWWYSAPLPAGRAIAVYLTDADLVAGRSLPALFRSCLLSTGQTRDRLAPLGEPKLRAVPAETSERGSCAGEGWLAVGDAAFSLDPLSGSGICRALESGLRAAEVVAAAIRGRPGAASGYRRSTREHFASQLRARAHYYGLERRWPASPFWSRRRA